MELVPVDDRILVQHLTEAERPKHGRIVTLGPQSFEPDWARVVAIGAGRITDSGVQMPPNCAVGDIVVVYPKAGHPINLDGRELWFIQPGNILAVVRDFVVPSALVAA